MIETYLEGAPAAVDLARRLAHGLADPGPAREETAQFLVARVQDRIDNAQTLFDALAASTIAGRVRQEARGERLVANLATPLRAFHDSVAKAATALRDGVPGSAYAQGTNSIDFGIDPESETAPWLRRATLGGPGPSNRARNVMALPDTDISGADDVMEHAVDKHLAESIGSALS